MTAPQGPKGDRGERGEQGPSRLPLRQARAIVVLVVIIVMLAGTSLLLTSREIGQNNAKWCATLITLDNANKGAPPPTSALGRHLVADFHKLREDLGCGP